jgi:hypothetical protein
LNGHSSDEKCECGDLVVILLVIKEKAADGRNEPQVVKPSPHLSIELFY